MAKKKKKFYAIKVGKNCNDVIVRDWNKCKELVHGYNSVYKSFATIEEANKYLSTVNVDNIREQKEFAIQKRKESKSKGTHVGFRIPNEIYTELEKRSKETGLNIEKIIEFAIAQYIF